MKTKVSSLCTVACLGICSFAHAQASDSTSTKFNHEGQRETIEESQSRPAPATTDQELQQDVDAMEENFEGATINKVGPNGEKLFRERGKYFYINDDGKKVKVKKSDVSNKPQDGNP